MQYEQCEGYDDPNRKDDKGQPVQFGMFGYPSAMLDTAIARDDPTGFDFYFSRYFKGGFEILGGETILQYVTRKRGIKIAAHLKRSKS